MTVYGDDCEITPGLVRGEKFTYLTDSKTMLLVSSPEAQRRSWRFAAFIMGISLSAAIGLWLDGRGFVWTLPLLFVALTAGLSLLGITRLNEPEEDWKLFIGSGDASVLIYSTSNAHLFEAKRAEIEQALLQRAE